MPKIGESMTTLVAIQGEGFAVIAADTQISADGFKSQSVNGKICQSGPTVIASAGNLRGINLLQYAWTAPSFGRYKSTDLYITRAFIPAMRKMFIEHGYDIKDSGFAVNGSQLIVAVKANLYIIEPDYAWDRVQSGIYAAGSGSDFAQGAMWSMDGHLQPNLVTAKNICIKAVEAAKFFDSATGYEIQSIVQTNR